jgi:beta-phosphoglucomutase-like phosphatase (HAD superfamily)
VGVTARRRHLKGKPAPDMYLAGTEALRENGADIVVTDLAELMEA